MRVPPRMIPAFAAACLFAAAGCPKAEEAVAPPASTAVDGHDHGHDDHGHDHAEHGEGHEHGAGPHGGTIVDWGGGKFHVELTVDHDKQEATVYILGRDEKTPTPIKAADGKVLLTITEPALEVELQAVPLEGETDGAASRYVGQHESLGTERHFAGSIIGEVDGTPYAGDFKEGPNAAHQHD